MVFLAADFFAVVAVAFFAAGVAFLAAVAVVFFAADFLAVAFLAAALAVVRVEEPPERLPLGAFFTATSFFGSFFEPLTRSLKP